MNLDKLIVEANNLDTSACFKLADYYESVKDYENSIYWLLKLQNNKEALFDLARIYELLGKPDESLEIYKRIFSLGGYDAASYLASLYEDLKNSKMAEYWYKKGVEKDDSLCLFTYAEFIFTQYDNNKLPEVISLLEKSIQLGRKDSALFLSELYIDENDCLNLDKRKEGLKLLVDLVESGYKPAIVSYTSIHPKITKIGFMKFILLLIKRFRKK